MPTWKSTDSARLLTFFSSWCCVTVRRSFCLLPSRSSSAHREDTLLCRTRLGPPCAKRGVTRRLCRAQQCYHGSKHEVKDTSARRLLLGRISQSVLRAKF